MPHPDEIIETKEDADHARRRAVRALKLTAIAGSSGLASLMRPDDIAPGPGRLAYRLAYGGLCAVTAGIGDTDRLGPVSAEERRTNLIAAGAAGVLCSALFDERIAANYWGDRALTKLGVRHPRIVGAVIAVGFTAVAAVIGDRAVREDEFFDEADFEERQVFLSPEQRALVERLITGGSANAKLLRAQLDRAEFTACGVGLDDITIEVPHAAEEERLVPHDHTHPVRARWTESGTELEMTLRIDEGRLAAISVDTVVDDDDEVTEIDLSDVDDDDEVFDFRGLTWPAADAVEIVRDER